MYIPNHKSNIFVSYAHDNNQQDKNNEGWISAFVQKLERKLGERLSKDGYSLWVDKEISRHTPLTPEIEGHVKSSAILVVVLSERYLDSDWCKREREVFWSIVQKKLRPDSRIFIVEYEEVKPDARPPELKELIGYRFWTQDHGSKWPRTLGSPDLQEVDKSAYFEQLNGLSIELANELKELNKVDSPIVVNSPAPSCPTIYLAPVTYDLDPDNDDTKPCFYDLDTQRIQVKRYLEQAQIRVLPETRYPEEPASFLEAVKKDLAQCSLFIQLLSPVVGKRSADLPHSYAKSQYESAQQQKLSILQWRSPDLNVNDVKDPNHQSFLGLETVQAVPIEEFKSTAVKRAFYRPPERTTVRPDQTANNPFLDALVFVNVEEGDRSLGEQLSNELTGQGADCVLPPSDITDSEKYRKEFEGRLMDCDAMLIVYDKVERAWVDNQLLTWRKIRRNRKHSPRALGLYEGPPPQKIAPTVKVADKPFVTCLDGVMGEGFKSFVDYLKQAPLRTEGDS
jgi:hypothetical protein